MENVNQTSGKLNCISFIYKREKVREDNDHISFIYQLNDIKLGYEVTNDFQNVCFIDEDGNHYGYIDDIYSLDEDIAYAFTIYLDENQKNNIDNKVSSIKKELDELRKYTLFQIYTKGTPEVKTYSVDPNNTDRILAIPTYSIDGIKSIFSNEYEKIEDIKSIIKSRIENIPVTCETQKEIYADEIYSEVSKTVLCQDSQIKSIAASISKNQKIDDPKLKDNLLICGPTGVGKTEIFRCISKIADLPMTLEDSTEYTANGYKGKDVTDMLYNLYLSAGRDIQKAQRGIIIVDEIDKKILDGGDGAQIYTKAVLDSLLKMAEGHVYHVETKNDKFDIDTSFITFVTSGAFSGIEKLNGKKRTMGFISKEEEKVQNDPSFNYTEETLSKYGLMPEFLGRSKLIVMNNLTEQDFCKIINESDKSTLLLYKYMLEQMGINLICEDGTIEAIAKKAISLGVGARSIKKILENAFEIINYQIFSRNNYSQLIINKDTIEDNTKFILR